MNFLWSLINLIGWEYKTNTAVLCACSKNWVQLEVGIIGADQKGARPLLTRMVVCSINASLFVFFLASSLSTSFFQIMIMNMRHWTIKNHTGEETLKLKIFFQKSSSYYNYCLKPFNIPIRRAAHRAVSYSKNLGYNINLNLHTWYICSTSDLSGLHQLVRFPNIKQLNIVSC